MLFFKKKNAGEESVRVSAGKRKVIQVPFEEWQPTRIANARPPRTAAERPPGSMIQLMDSEQPLEPLDRPPGEVIDVSILPCIAPTLKAAGFSRSGKRKWVRHMGNVIQVVLLIGGRWNTRFNASFDLHIGTMPPETYEKTNGQLVIIFPLTENSAKWITVGAIEVGGVPRWGGKSNFEWHITGDTDLDGIGEDVKDAIRERVLPYLADGDIKGNAY
jgi:hypothetical protein